jgi:hypothetical protein
MTDIALAQPRRCHGLKSDGRPCGAPPMRESDCCFWHAPETAEDAADARRLGGQRRRREKVVSETYGLTGLATVTDIRRVLDLALLDALALDNSIARARVIVQIAMAATRLLDPRELEERLLAYEKAASVRPVLRSVSSLLDDMDDDVNDEELVH